MPVNARLVLCFSLLICLAVGAPLSAQAEQDLIVEHFNIQTQLGTYGQPQQVVSGSIVNTGDQAYHEIFLYAEVHDKSGEIIGEGMGYLVNACGAGLVEDFTLLPNARHDFQIALELYEADASVKHVNIIPEAAPLEDAPDTADARAGMTQISRDEIVAVEWQDAQTFYYAAGCERDVFTEHTWSVYDGETGESAPLEHPDAALVTDVFRTRLSLQEDEDYHYSRLTFAPQGRRLFYQARLNIANTAERDGSFVRTLYTHLYNRTLQGVTWLADSRFLAYYYGAYSDDVYYFTANADGQKISRDPLNSQPSVIVPGASPDGTQAIIGATLDDETGYFLTSLQRDETELLLESDLPGNNFPAPIFAVDDEGATIYLARLIDDQAELHCVDLETRESVLLAPLPLQVTTDERAWWWLSPDAETIALAANGMNSGLWLIDLTAFDGC